MWVATHEAAGDSLRTQRTQYAAAWRWVRKVPLLSCLVHEPPSWNAGHHQPQPDSTRQPFCRAPVAPCHLQRPEGEVGVGVQAVDLGALLWSARGIDSGAGSHGQKHARKRDRGGSQLVRGNYMTASCTRLFVKTSHLLLIRLRSKDCPSIGTLHVWKNLQGCSRTPEAKAGNRRLMVMARRNQGVYSSAAASSAMPHLHWQRLDGSPEDFDLRPIRHPVAEATALVTVQLSVGLRGKETKWRRRGEGDQGCSKGMCDRLRLLGEGVEEWPAAS